MSIDAIVIEHAVQGITAGLSKAEIRTDIAQNTNLRKTTIDMLLDKAYAQIADKADKGER